MPFLWLGVDDTPAAGLHLPNQLPPGDRRQTRVTMCHERSFLPLVLATGSVRSEGALG